MTQAAQTTFTQHRPMDSAVACILQEQHVQDGQTLRFCQFVFPHEHEDQVWLFHLLTKQVISVPTKDYQAILQAIAQEPSTLTEASSDLAHNLFGAYFLVPENQDDEQFYLELLDLLDICSPRHKGINGYTILPTTACNARCVYCFELGCEYVNMDDATTEATIRYILDNRPEEGGVSISWFGGEPLMGAKRIRQICAALDEAHVEFSSSMVSNGTLFDAELAAEAAQNWHLKSVQITLDGYKEEHNRRKNTWDANLDAYTLSREAIDHLLAAGIRVNVRLNCDRANLEEQKRLMLELFDEYEGQGLLNVYLAVLYGIVEPEEEAKLIRDINTWLASLGKPELPSRNMFLERRLKRNFCMADTRSTALIDPQGNLYDCEHLDSTHIYGNVFEGTTKPELYERMKTRMPVHKRCQGCKYLPQCSTYTACPQAFTVCKDTYDARIAIDAEHAIEILLRKPETDVNNNVVGSDVATSNQLANSLPSDLPEDNLRPNC